MVRDTTLRGSEEPIVKEEPVKPIRCITYRKVYDEPASQTKELSQENAYEERVVGNAEILLKKYLPDWCPTEPVILIRADEPRTMGRYIGRVRGKHYLLLSHRNYQQEIPLGKELEDTITILHEMIHARHAEEHVKYSHRNDYYGPDQDSLFTDDDLTSLSITDIIARMDNASIGYYKQNSSSLFSVMIEGIATSGEMYVVRQYAEQLEQTGDVERARLLAVVLQEKRGQLEKAKESPLARIGYGLDASYVNGVDMVRKMVPDSNINAIHIQLKQIDLNKCRQVSFGSSEFKGVLSNDTGILEKLKYN